RQSLPEIALWEQDDMNVHGLDMVRWFAVVKELRHATVHAGGLLSPAQWNRLGPTGLALLRKHFRGHQTASGYRLALDSDNARAALKTFAGYALLIYLETSRREGLDAESFKR